MAAIAYPTRNRGSAAPRQAPYDHEADRTRHLRLVDPADRAVARNLRSQPSRRAAVRPAAKLRPFGAGALTLSVLVGCWFGASALTTARPAHVDPPAGSTSIPGGFRYVARVGDTLWSIASNFEPNADPRPLVDELAAQLHGGVLEPGDILHLPAS